MELQRPIMSEQERETLIQRICEDKGGRVDRGWGLALYIALDSPRPNLAQITESILDGLSGDPVFGFQWAEDWGRVVICVGPGAQLNCRLGDMNDNESKKFVPVHTTQKLELSDMQQLLTTLPEGKLGTILINRDSMTIEAFLIAYIHLVDQAVWDIFRAKFDQSNRVGRSGVYEEAVNLVREHRFLVRLAGEEEILLAKILDDRVVVRLYGSGVNKDVSRVMGAVVPRKE